MNALPRPTRVIAAVAQVTFSELLRDKVLYSSIFVGLALLSIAVLTSHLSFIQPDRIIVDFGISGVGLTLMILATLMGSLMLNREFDRRTIYVALSHPISRGQFVVGKWLGLTGVLLLNWVLLAAMFLSIRWLAIYGGETPLATMLNRQIAWGLLLLFFQASLVGAIGIFFSTLSSTAVSSLITLGVFMLGVNRAQIDLIATRTPSLWLKNSLNAISWGLPDFEKFHLGFKITYGLPISGESIAWTVAYALMWILIALFGATLTVQTKES